MEFISSSPNDLDIPAKELSKLIAQHNIIVFEGEMGAGKTTFIKAFCKELGITDEISSPTFSLVNEYRLRDGKPVYHFDFYRINDISEAEDMGIYEYFDNGICLIEWGEKIAALLEREETLTVHIKPQPDGNRQIEFKQ